MPFDRSEPLNTLGTYWKTRRKRWCFDGRHGSQVRHIAVGTLAAGGWFVEGADGRAWLVSGETAAHDAALELMAELGQPWREVPAAYDAAAEPVDRDRWVKTGNAWVLRD